MSPVWPALHKICLAAVFAASLCSPAVAASQFDSATLEYRIKAGFLLNFARFTMWPPEATSESANRFRFCVIGEDHLQEAFDAMNSRKVNNRAVAIGRYLVVHSGNIAKIRECQVLFTSSLSAGEFAALQTKLKGYPILTVTDNGQQGIIDLAEAGGRIEFTIDLGAAEAAGLKLSSQLLKLARTVRR